MPDEKDTHVKTPDNQTAAETPKKPVQTIDDQEKAKARAAVPNPPDQEHKEPEKKSA